MTFLKKTKPADWISWGALCAVCAVSLYTLLYHIAFAEPISFIVHAALAALFAAAAAFIALSRTPFLWALVCAASVVYFGFTNGVVFGEIQNPAMLIQAVLTGAAAIAGTVLYFRGHERARAKGWLALALALFFAVSGGAAWAGNFAAARAKDAPAQNELFAVPEKYDAKACPQAGTVQEFSYATRAYATDKREVQKTACVYLPYGYDAARSYNILYLMHGTGDSYDYWLVGHPENKTMLDNLIYHGDIAPLIVVTPTWYVENDCKDDLDVLTYTFKDELRNDLMPAVESEFSTFAAAADADGFTQSRDHRAFAGLSRGSVTAYHAAMIGSLDYFSWFGNFSGCRTGEEEFAAIREGALAEYPIRYLYCTNGGFDFSLYDHVKIMRGLLEKEARLAEGVNYSFDIFPMQYHSAANWHISLYNALQKFFAKV